MDHPRRPYDLDADGAPIPGTYHSVPANPQRMLSSSLMAPINGLYGIEDASGNVNVWNSGELFGAIDVALFILVIGGFLGVTMKTGAIQAGIARVVERLKGRERWMIPILMTSSPSAARPTAWPRRAWPSTRSIITVMIAAGYDALVAARRSCSSAAGSASLGSTINPFATGIASGFAGIADQRGPDRAARHPDRRHGDRHLLRDALRRPGQDGPDQVARLRPEGRERGALLRVERDGRRRRR